MKWMVASDIHGSAKYCRELLDAYEREKADRLLLLGDLLYHGPRNDLPEEYAPKMVIAMLNAKKNQILCVRGNCDAEVDQMVLEFPILADYCMLDLGTKLVYATHGHLTSAEQLPPLREGDLFLQGHTHVPMKRGKKRDSLHESGICVAAKAGQLARIYDSGNKSGGLERIGWNDSGNG